MTRIEDAPVATEEAVARQQAERGAGTQGELWPEMVRLERERIEGQNRRTDSITQAIAASDSADQRQFEYHMEKLRRDDEDRSVRRAFGMRLVGSLILLGTLFVAACLALIAFGDEGQRTAGFYLLAGLGAMCGGYGVISGIVRAVGRFMKV